MIRGVVLVGLAAAACSQERAPERAVAPRLGQPVAERSPTPPPRPAALTQVTIKALGMYCEESCPLRVRTALADIPVVYELGFDVSTESIFVSFDSALGSAKDVTRPMLAAITSAGFDPWLAREAWPADASVQVVTR